jgi:hypothetical protein
LGLFYFSNALFFFFDFLPSLQDLEVMIPHFSDHRREREEGESLVEEDQTERKGEK